MSTQQIENHRAKIAADFKSHAKEYGIPLTLLGQQFKHAGKFYTLKGVLLYSPKFPFAAEDSEGRACMFPTHVVKREFKIQ